MAKSKVKKSQIQLPHFSRKILEKILARLNRYRFRLYLGSILVLVILLVLNLITPLISPWLSLSSLEKSQIKAQNQSKNPLAHLELAEELLENQNLAGAQKELAVARALINHKQEPIELNIVAKKVQQIDELAKQVIKWEKIKKTYPHFRDSHLQLAYYYYQLNRLEKAKENLAIALSLDPNFEPARELEIIINQTGNWILMIQSIHAHGWLAKAFDVVESDVQTKLLLVKEKSSPYNTRITPEFKQWLDEIGSKYMVDIRKRSES